MFTSFDIIEKGFSLFYIQSDPRAEHRQPAAGAGEPAGAGAGQPPAPHLHLYQKRGPALHHGQ